MSVTFTKLFSSITESTVWQEDNETRLVWIAMLAMADRKGRVWGSVPGLAHRARVSVEGAQRALGVFMAPDPFSRTKDHEGRRIGEIDGGWILLNHAKYRAIRDDEETKESKRVWAANNRKKVEKVDQTRTPSNEVGTNRCNAESESEADAEAKSETITLQPKVAVERKPDLVWDALTEAVGSKGAKSKQECSKFGKAVKDLKALMVGMSADEMAAEIKRRALNYPLLYPNATFTEFALLSHWSRLDAVQPALSLPGTPASHVNGANGTNIANGVSGASQAISPNVLIIQWTKELEDCQEKLDAIRYSYDGHQAWARDDVDRYNRILARKKELAALLKRKE